MITQLIEKANANPRKLFLIDGFGAIVTAFLTGVILVYFESFFGMPKAILIPLALVACVFAIYSFTCYFSVHNHWQVFLKIIAIANLLYCCVTLGFAIAYFEQLTIFGIFYFIGEILIVVTLVNIEWKISSTDSKENTD